MARTDHPSFPQPSDSNVKIWRYMEFQQFVSMLQNEGLWFSNMQNFIDPYEGCNPKRHPEVRDWYRRFFQSEGISDQQMDQLEETMDKVHYAVVENSYANCWNQSEFESDALWRIYGGNGKEIAIQSRYSLLLEELPQDVKIDPSRLNDQVKAEETEMFLGQITYLPNDDFEKLLAGHERSNVIHTNLMHKRESFSFEKEIRALYTELIFEQNNPNRWPARGEERPGDWIPVSLQNLIEQVVIGPHAPIWYDDLVNGVLETYQLEINVQRSQLYNLT